MTALRVAAPAAAVNSIDDIPGWFPPIDQQMFAHFLSPDAVVPMGDLVELGVYLGKSAAFIGRFKRDDELFTVCDLFETPARDGSNSQENAKSYATLDRAAFERNYLALFDELPIIVQDASSTIVDHVKEGSVRFLHIDASHLYDQVAIDVDSARTLLRPDGLVVFDDYRSDHTPGVSAAVWEAVFNKGLRPVCLTQQKLYGTFGDAAAYHKRLRAWLEQCDHLRSETQLIAGLPVVRVALKPPAESPAKPAARASTNAELARRVNMLEKKVFQLQLEASSR